MVSGGFWRLPRGAALLLTAIAMTACGQSASSATAADAFLAAPTRSPDTASFDAVYQAADSTTSTQSFSLSVTDASAFGGNGNATGQLDDSAGKVSLSLKANSIPGTTTALYIGDTMYVRASQTSKGAAKPWTAFAANDSSVTLTATVIPALVLDPAYIIDEIKLGVVSASPGAATGGNSTYDVSVDLVRVEQDAQGPAKALDMEAAQAQLGTTGGSGSRFLHLRIAVSKDGTLQSIQLDQRFLGAGFDVLSLHPLSSMPALSPPPSDQITDLGTASANEGEKVKGKDGDAS